MGRKPGWFKDLTGLKFGRLTVLNIAEKSKVGILRWNCICECGGTATVQGASLKNGHTISCGCYCKEINTKLIVERSKKIWEPRIVGDVCFIPLSQDREAMIDYEDFYKIKEYSWYYSSNGYAMSHRKGYASGYILLHDLIIEKDKGKYIDHISCDRLDNRKSNLRIVTFSNNVTNSKISKRNTSGYKGVCFDKQTGRWRTSIRSNGKKINMGRFVNKEDAAKVYDEYSRILNGEYARYNMPKEGERSCLI